MQQRGNSSNYNYNARKVVEQNKTSAQQLQASGVFEDTQPGKRSLLELLAAARDVRDWPLYGSILKHIRGRLNVSYGISCQLKESAKIFSEHLSKITKCKSDSDVSRIVEEVYREMRKLKYGLQLEAYCRSQVWLRSGLEPTTAQLKFMLEAEGRFNSSTAGPAEIQAYETLVAQTKQAELKQAVEQASTTEKVGEELKVETETANGIYTGDRDPEWCPALGSSVHIHIGKLVGEAVDTRTTWQVVDLGKLEKAGKILVFPSGTGTNVCSWHYITDSYPLAPADNRAAPLQTVTSDSLENAAPSPFESQEIERRHNLYKVAPLWVTHFTYLDACSESSAATGTAGDDRTGLEILDNFMYFGVLLCSSMYLLFTR